MWKPQSVQKMPVPQNDAPAWPQAQPDRDKEPRASAPPSTHGVVFGKDVRIVGTLWAQEDVTLQGHLEGMISVPEHTLTIAERCIAQAEVTAAVIRVFGAVTGKLTATRRIEIFSSGSVDGDIVAPQITVLDGAFVHGVVNMRPKEEMVTALVTRDRKPENRRSTPKLPSAGERQPIAC